MAGDGSIIPVGKTFQGQIRVSKERIRDSKASVILFCSQYTFCGAILVNQPNLSILEFDEFYLELAPFVLA